MLRAILGVWLRSSSENILESSLKKKKENVDGLYTFQTTWGHGSVTSRKSSWGRCPQLLKMRISVRCCGSCGGRRRRDFRHRTEKVSGGGHGGVRNRKTG